MKKALFTTVFLAAVLLLCCFGSSFAAENEVVFSLASGFYEEPITLEVSAPEGTTVYYTLDGTVPDETDLLYQEPIFLDLSTNKPDLLKKIEGTTLDIYDLPTSDYPSAHVVRAVAIDSDGGRVGIASGTYFVGYNRQEKYGDLPIISLMIEPNDFFDYETGIYMLGKTFEQWEAEREGPYETWEVHGNFTNRGREWERPVTVEFMMGEDTFVQDMGVRIKGGVSRTAPQKSLRLIARDEYGQKNIKYPLFPDNLSEKNGELLEKYKTVTLRNGGNDRGFALIRDPYISRLSEGLRFETAANRPVMGFINGEYWGIYTFNEEYNDNFIDYHYGINNDNVITFKNNEIEDGTEEDANLYWEMYDFMIGEDMTDPAIYEQAAEMLDIGSYTDYLAVALYISNEDGFFQGNNWQMWRVREPGKDESELADGKWRMMLFDTDYSSGIYSNGETYAHNNLNDSFFVSIGDDGHPAWILECLMENEDFQDEMIRSLCDVRNFYFQRDRAKALLDEMTEWYLPYVPETYRRFGPMWGENWDTEVAFKDHLMYLGVFFDGRYRVFPYHIQESFDLSDPVTGTLQSSDASKGAIYVNGRTIPVTNALEVQYFPEYSITVTAEPEEGATFVGWQVDSDQATVADPTALTTEVTFTGQYELTAVFE